jgi:oligoribonuclease NrnB/cAMP/cGMP phosphodiesterase (DHH superfamily)
MLKPICIYHGNCADGFGAAYSVWKLHPDWAFYPGTYGQQPPDVTDRQVILVDFSYKRPVLEEMAQKAKSILVLDHHKTAKEDLEEFPEPPTDVDNPYGWLPEKGVFALFDMSRSGAGITWDYFHTEERPPLINHIEDRDLWRFDLPGTREIQAAVFSYPYDFKVWDDLMFGYTTDQLQEQGKSIERKHLKDINELLEKGTRRIRLGTYSIWAANLPYTMSSDAGNMLCKVKDAGPFGACYWDTPEGRVFSLRSIGDFDVSEIAKSYGGGGHKNASGFKLNWEQVLKMEVGESF